MATSNRTSNVGGRVARKTERQRTFVLSGDAGFDYAHLREILTTEGWVELPIKYVHRQSEGWGTRDRPVHLLYAELLGNMKFDKRTYSIHCQVKNFFESKSKECVTDKSQLHFNLKREFPAIYEKYVPRTRLLSDVQEVCDNEVLILRPAGSGAYAGNGIRRVSTTEALLAAKRDMLSRWPRSLATTYIDNPLLIDGKKSHLRLYWLFRQATRSESSRSFLWHRGKFMTASRAYRSDQLDDDSVHDTHMKSTVRNLYFPEHAREWIGDDGCRSLLSQANELLPCLHSILAPSARTYEEADMAFEVFALDFLVTADTNRLILLEANRQVNYRPVPVDRDPDVQSYARFTKDYFLWVYENAIGVLMPKA